MFKLKKLSPQSMARQKKGLQRKLILAIILIVIVIPIIGLSLNLYLQTKSIYNEIEEQATITSSVFKANITHSLASQRYEALQLMAGFLLKNNADVKYVYVYNDDGTILADGSPGSKLKGHSLQDTSSLQSVEASSRMLKYDQKTLEVTEPIYYKNRKIGGVRIGFKPQEFMTKAIVLRDATLILIGVSILLGVFLIFVLTITVIEPLHKLHEAVNIIWNTGNLKYRIGMEGHDEIAMISQAFDNLTSQLDQTTSALKASEQKFRTLFEESAGAVFLLETHSCKIIDCNHAAEKLLKASHDEIVGRHYIDFTPPHLTQEVKDNINQICYRGCEQQLETEFHDSEGKRIPVLNTARIITIEGQQLLMSVVVDISATKAMEDSLKEAKDRAKQESISKSQFMGTLSYQLKKRLNIVLEKTAYLKKNFYPNADQRQVSCLNSIASCTEDLLNKANNLLSLSHIELDNLDLHYTDFDLSNFIEEISNYMRPKVENKNLAFYSKVSSEIPLEVHGNRSFLWQVLFNLLDNALKFTDPPGEISLEVRLAKVINPQTNMILFAVCDTGPKVPAEQRKYDFEKQRLLEDITDHDQPSTNLELAVSKAYVRKMGGNIVAKCWKDHGYAVAFTVPLEVLTTIPSS
ncbi:MAG: ATP-binding protein [Chlamydiota bacterium]